ncbi:MAG: hypothetical protein IPL95_19430 [Saprospiraceae bacterium]|nr:hypothetical protein [Saprospiraceae bacterium]
MRYLYIFLIIATFIKSYSQNSDSNNKFEYLNIDHKVYTFFYAYSIPNKYLRCNGCAISNNIPKFLKDSIPSNKEGLKIWIDNSKLDTFGRNYHGYKVYLANQTDSVYQFDVDDSNLYLRIQAIDFNNEWRYIDNIHKQMRLKSS